MLERDLEALRNSVAVPALEGLEAGIWQKIAADQEAARQRRIVLTCQASVVAMVVVVGIALSGVAPRDASASPGFDAFSLRGLPAPSTLLLGSHS
ncbi:MAG: hypothetical protein K2P94_16910 [Rhodospirillaceae bacterium]|nr:hypothetical protein [Rhodospirillaceae bacterium]